MKPTTAACNNRTNDKEEDYVAMKWLDDEKRIIIEVDGDFIFLGAEEVWDKRTPLASSVAPPAGTPSFFWRTGHSQQPPKSKIVIELPARDQISQG
jgi:hypothetical protein